MPSTYSGAVAVDPAIKAGENPSLNDWGCVGDGSTDDTVKFLAAMNDVVASTRAGVLLIPGGKTYCVQPGLAVPSGLTLVGTGPSSIIQPIGTASSTAGIFDLNGVSKVTLRNFAIAGRVTSPALITYASSPTPYDADILSDTSIWIRGGADITVQGLSVNNGGGYFVFVDARAASISRVKILSNKITNARPDLFGVSGDVTYSGWGGGIFWANDGVSYLVDDLLIQENQFYCCTGNCIWGHANTLTLQNKNIRVIGNSGQDVGEWIEMVNVNGGIVSKNHVTRCGYISTADNTVGTPKWLNSGGFNVPCVAYDTSGLVMNVPYVNNTADAVNGGFIDADGLCYCAVSGNTGTSSWASSDPHAQASACGPGASGVNWSYGFNTGDSNANAGGSFINVTGNVFNGFGGGERLYGARSCSLSGNTINHPATAPSVPISYGPIVAMGTVIQPTGNTIGPNDITWNPSSGGAIVAEDGSYAAFTSASVNTVYKNNGNGGNNFPFLKDPNSGGSALLEEAFSLHDPRAHGARMDGASDDTVAVAKAISHGGLYLHSTLRCVVSVADFTALSAEFRIFGGGELILQAGTNGPLIKLGSTPCEVFGVTLNGNSATGTGNPVVLVTSATTTRFTSVRIKGGQGAAVTLVNSTAGFANCDASGNASGLTTSGTSTAYVVGCFGIPTNIV